MDALENTRSALRNDCCNLDAEQACSDPRWQAEAAVQADDEIDYQASENAQRSTMGEASLQDGPRCELQEEMMCLDAPAT
jgi:chitodextrinase